MGYATLLSATACAGDDSSDPPPKKPDTGYGKSEPVPPTQTCVDFCARAGECAEALCNEDSHSTRYTGLGDVLGSICEGQCSDSIVSTKITAAEWQCMFQDSCRQAFDSAYDSCHTQASYTCN